MEICRNDGNVSSFLAIFVPRESRYHNRRSGFLVPENFSRKFRKVFRCLTRGAQLNSKQRGVFFKRDDVGPKELASLNPAA